MITALSIRVSRTRIKVVMCRAARRVSVRGGTGLGITRRSRRPGIGKCRHIAMLPGVVACLRQKRGRPQVRWQRLKKHRRSHDWEELTNTFAHLMYACGTPRRLGCEHAA